MDNREEQLRARAYEIWQSEGQPDGRDREHWEMAERELTAPDVDTPTSAPPAPSSPDQKAAPADPVAASDMAQAKPKVRKSRAVKPR